MSDVKATVGTFMIDCADPEALFAFWAEITGVEVASRYPDYIFTTKLPDSGIGLAFQRVPESKSGKNRAHIDLHHPNPEAFIAQVIDLGGSRLADHGDEAFSWSVLADPEGNEFCVTKG